MNRYTKDIRREELIKDVVGIVLCAPLLYVVVVLVMCL